MRSMITMALAFMPAVLAALIARNRGAHPSQDIQPPKSLSSLPQVEMVDIRALLKRWED